MKKIIDNNDDFNKFYDEYEKKREEAFEKWLAELEKYVRSDEVRKYWEALVAPYGIALPADDDALRKWAAFSPEVAKHLFHQKFDLAESRVKSKIPTGSCCIIVGQKFAYASDAKPPKDVATIRFPRLAEVVFVKCEFANVHFALNRSRFINCTFRNCSFHGGEIVEARATPPHDGYQNCEFHECLFGINLRITQMGDEIFHDVEHAVDRKDQIIAPRGHFFGCIFNVVFGKTIDFRQSKFQDCTTITKRALDGSPVLFPSDGIDLPDGLADLYERRPK